MMYKYALVITEFYQFSLLSGRLRACAILMLIHRHCQMTPPAVSHTDGDGRVPFACLVMVTLFPLRRQDTFYAFYTFFITSTTPYSLLILSYIYKYLVGSLS